MKGWMKGLHAGHQEASGRCRCCTWQPCVWMWSAGRGHNRVQCTRVITGWGASAACQGTPWGAHLKSVATCTRPCEAGAGAINCYQATNLLFGGMETGWAHVVVHAC